MRFFESHYFTLCVWVSVRLDGRGPASSKQSMKVIATFTENGLKHEVLLNWGQGVCVWGEVMMGEQGPLEWADECQWTQASSPVS